VLPVDLAVKRGREACWAAVVLAGIGISARAYGYVIVFLKSKKSLELKGFQSLWKQLCSWQNCRKRIRSLTPLWMFCRSFRCSFSCWLSFGKPRWVSVKSRFVRLPIRTCPSTWFDRDRTVQNPIVSGSFFMGAAFSGTVPELRSFSFPRSARATGELDALRRPLRTTGRRVSRRHSYALRRNEKFYLMVLI
jgi:hypothetical protein